MRNSIKRNRGIIFEDQKK